MAITYTFSISSEKPNDMYVTLGMSKYIVKHPFLGKFNFIKCSFNIIRNKINNVSIVITPYVHHVESFWDILVSQHKQDIFKLINQFVAKYNEHHGLISAIQFDTSILELSETIPDNKLRNIVTMVEMQSSNCVWIDLSFKPKAKITD